MFSRYKITVVSLEKISDSSILLDGCVLYDTSEPVAEVENVADNYVQLITSSDSILLITSFTRGDIVVVSSTGKMSRPINNGFSRTYHLLGDIAQLLINHGFKNSMLSTIDDQGSICLIIPILFNGKTIAVEFIDGFSMSDTTSLSPTGENTFDPPTLKKLQKWACAIGSLILRKACAYYEEKTVEQKLDSYYFNCATQLNQVHDYLENLYNPCYEYDFITGKWTCSRYVKKILGIDDHYQYDFGGLMNLFARESKRPAYNYFSNILRIPREDIDIDLKIIRPDDGEPRWITIKGSYIIGSDGEVMKVFGSILDITLYKETQQRLKNEIEERTRLMGIIGHDLRNPFNAMLGFSEMLTKVLKQKRYDAAIEYAQIMRESASHGYDLLVNILDYSKSETGKLKMVSELFNIEETIESIISLVKPMAERKEITITSTIEPDTMVTGDPTMLSTVLRNLISNAIKFCYRGGAVSIDIQQLPDSRKRIIVTDTGIDISPKNLMRIANDREIESTPGTNGEPGTGLGLKLCNSFLAQHNSRLEAESGNGVTSFSFII